jgi:N-acetylgalactosamine kinase
MASRATELHPVRRWIHVVEDAGSAFHQTLLGLCAGRADLCEEAGRMCLKALGAFVAAHGADRKAMVIRTAGRVNVLGRHIDHRGGSVNPVAVNHMWLIAAPRDDDLVTARNVESGRFPDEQFRICECLPQRSRIADWDAWCNAEYDKRRGNPAITWSNYIRAAVLYLQHVHTDSDGTFTRRIRGMDTVFYGNIPRAVGLSSSSAVVVATAEAVVRMNGLHVTPAEMVRHCGYAEWYVGTRGGSSDHAAIIFARPGAILHAAAFAASVETMPIPDGYSLVLANSGIEAKKQAGARNVFNSRVAAYIFGLMLIKKQFPQHADRLEHLRDVNSACLGVSESEIYRIVRTLPLSARRDELLAQLPEQDHQKMHRVFRSHDEPAEGYPIRQVCLYGIAECIRADMVPQCLRTGDVARFGELMSISHDGDRVTRLVDGVRVPVDNSCPDARLDGLIEDFRSSEPQRVERARLWRQGGGYSVSVPDVDTLVDIALATPGVAGAGLVGAGMGGCIVAIVESRHAQQLIANLAGQYYRPRNLPLCAEVVTPVAGLHTFDVT